MGASTGELIRTLQNILKATEKNPVAAREGTNGASVHVSARSWVWPVAIGAAVIVVAILWKTLSDRRTGGGTEIHHVPKPVETPVVAAAPGPRPPLREDAAAPPAPTPVPTPAAATPALSPVIHEFKAIAATRRARLCYHVSNADSLLG